uniref:Uncharacterized protein n=1 Tax=Acrobeloides nanus TaxID=290746 RepID=A0A914D554_9BILA
MLEAWQVAAELLSGSNRMLLQCLTDEETRAEAGTQLGTQQNVDQQQAAQQAFDRLDSGRKKRQQGFKLGGRKKRQQGFKLGRGK